MQTGHLSLRCACVIVLVASVVAVSQEAPVAAASEMSEFHVFLEKVYEAQVELVQGRPEAFKALWSHSSDVTIFGGFGSGEKGWDKVGPWQDWASAQFSSASYTPVAKSGFSTKSPSFCSETWRNSQSGAIVEGVPDAWLFRGSHPDAYAVGLTEIDSVGGRRSAFVTSPDSEPVGFATLMQVVDAIPDSGRRLKITAYVKSVAVQTRAGLWLRFDDSRGKAVVLENMEGHPIQGTHDWTAYELTLSVPSEGTRTAFGVLLFGAGTIYVDSLSFEVLDAAGARDDEATGVFSKAVANLDFEK